MRSTSDHAADARGYDFESPEGVRPPGFELRALQARAPYETLSRLAEDAVRCGITLGSPFSGPASASNARRLYQAVSGRHAHHPAYFSLLKRPPQVPTSSIFSRSDGVVAWQASVLEEHPLAENIEVFSSHTGMALHPAVLHAIGDRLAQPEGQWQPLQRTGLLQWFYGDTRRLPEAAAA